MSQRSHLISCKCKHLHRPWWNQNSLTISSSEDSNSVMHSSIIEVCIPFSILWINKTLGACHVHVLGNHSSRRTLFCFFNYHISKLKYVVIATLIRTDKTSLRKIKSYRSQLLEHCRKTPFSTCRPFRRWEHPRLFLYRSIYARHASCYRRVYQAPSLIDTILDFMVISHLTELGPINASLHVVGSSLFYNNDLFSNLLFDHKTNQTYEVQ